MDERLKQAETIAEVRQCVEAAAQYFDDEVLANACRKYVSVFWRTYMPGVHAKSDSPNDSDEPRH
jgi:hypothetical protein